VVHGGYDGEKGSRVPGFEGSNPALHRIPPASPPEN
jgi:hypothetical protein